MQGDRHAQEISTLTNAAVPIMVVPGNAEVFCYLPPTVPAWGACMMDYQSRYIMPRYAETKSLWSTSMCVVNAKRGDRLTIAGTPSTWAGLTFSCSTARLPSGVKRSKTTRSNASSWRPRAVPSPNPNPNLIEGRSRLCNAALAAGAAALVDSSGPSPPVLLFQFYRRASRHAARIWGHSGEIRGGFGLSRACP
jgi:hypothetical protein